MIRLTKAQEDAFGRIQQADALDALEDVFKAELLHVRSQYEKAKEALVVAGDRSIALQLRGSVATLTDILDLFARQKA